MKKFEGILLCSDLDGTLLREDKSISRENLDAIEYFKSEGGYFTLVTGRMPCSARPLYEKIRPNAPIGCINGGGIYDFETDRYLWSNTLPRDVVELIDSAVSAVPSIGVLYNTLDAVHFCRDNARMTRFRADTGLPNKVGDYKTMDKPAAKVVLGENDVEKVFTVVETLKNHPKNSMFDYVRSEKCFYEILPKGSSKGNLLVRLAEILGVDMAKTVAIGDYNNDVSMIKAAGVGIAVANATDEAKAAADLITVSNEESAIAKIINDFDVGILKL